MERERLLLRVRNRGDRSLVFGRPGRDLRPDLLEHQHGQERAEKQDAPKERSQILPSNHFFEAPNRRVRHNVKQTSGTRIMRTYKRLSKAQSSKKPYRQPPPRLPHKNASDRAIRTLRSCEASNPEPTIPTNPSPVDFHRNPTKFP